ncbi:MAG TPA: hypothetical protein VGV92_08145 [Gammaproteobacteria bacterium]|nr:hypothetical protein [Gammaproteobacteria bacterium]
MALTKDFRSTVMERAHSDKEFCKAMLAGAVDEIFSGDAKVGKAILRDYVSSLDGAKFCNPDAA